MKLKEKVYLEMKKLIADYELEQLNKDNVTNHIEKPYIEEIIINKKLKYNPKFGDNRVCKCEHPYHRHFDSYDEMAVVGCKYCECFYFEES